MWLTNAGANAQSIEKSEQSTKSSSTLTASTTPSTEKEEPQQTANQDLTSKLDPNAYTQNLENNLNYQQKPTEDKITAQNLTTQSIATQSLQQVLEAQKKHNLPKPEIKVVDGAYSAITQEVPSMVTVNNTGNAYYANQDLLEQLNDLENNPVLQESEGNLETPLELSELNLNDGEYQKAKDRTRKYDRYLHGLAGTVWKSKQYNIENTKEEEKNFSSIDFSQIDKNFTPEIDLSSLTNNDDTQIAKTIDKEEQSLLNEETIDLAFMSQFNQDNIDSNSLRYDLNNLLSQDHSYLIEQKALPEDNKENLENNKLSFAERLKLHQEKYEQSVVETPNIQNINDINLTQAFLEETKSYKQKSQALYTNNRTEASSDANTEKKENNSLFIDANTPPDFENETSNLNTDNQLPPTISNNQGATSLSSDNIHCQNKSKVSSDAVNNNQIHFPEQPESANLDEVDLDKLSHERINSNLAIKNFKATCEFDKKSLYYKSEILDQNAKTYPLCYDESDKNTGCILVVYESINNNATRRETPFLHGLKNGIERFYIQYRDSMRLSEEIPYVDGKLQGLYRYYDTNSILWKIEPYINDQLNGYVRYFYQNGDIRYQIPYIKGKREGLSKNYNEQGVIVRTDNYVDNKLNGISSLYTDQGNLISQTPYKKDRIDGLLKRYYPNGKLRAQIPYQNGEVNGIVTYFHQNGKIQSVTPLQQGNNKGIQQVYYEDGTLRSESRFYENVKYSITYNYYQSGDLNNIRLSTKEVVERIGGSINIFYLYNQPYAEVIFDQASVLYGKCLLNDHYLDQMELTNLLKQGKYPNKCKTPNHENAPTASSALITVNDIEQIIVQKEKDIATYKQLQQPQSDNSNTEEDNKPKEK